jgi:hypothetical protein
VICDQLGISRDAATRMRQWRQDAYKASATSSQLPPQPDMTTYFEEVLEQHRRRPRPGLLADLCRAALRADLGHRRRWTHGMVRLRRWLGADEAEQAAQHWPSSPTGAPGRQGQRARIRGLLRSILSRPSVAFCLRRCKLSTLS